MNATGDHVQVRCRASRATPMDLTAPFVVGNAQLAFDGAAPILLIAKYGAVA